MANVLPFLRCEINPLQPVSEICAIITAVMPYHPDSEEQILIGIGAAIEKRIQQLRGAEQQDAKQICESIRDE